MQITKLNTDAVFSDGTQNYCNPMEPKRCEVVSVRLRVGKEDNLKCFAVINGVKKPLVLISGDEYFNFFETNFKACEDFIEYYFEIVFDNKTYYYARLGLEESVPASSHLFNIFTDFKTPDWAKGAIFYQIFVDRFFNADKSNDVKYGEYKYLDELSYTKSDWNACPSVKAVPEFFGGDLKGVIKKLDYLKDLGVSAIYLNPIFVSPSNHKYDTQDYDYVDPHFGEIIIDEDCSIDKNSDNSKARAYIKRTTEKENLEASNRVLIELIENAHKRGIKVVLDGVFNHCGSFNKWLDVEGIYNENISYEKGAFIDKNSPYNSYFKFENDDFPFNNSYDKWWGHSTLPKLNYENSRILYDDILRIAKKWVSPPFNADGWRLDVAADLGYSSEFNHRFWKDFRKEVKTANPDAIIIAEHYGSAKDYLGTFEWDTVMNYDAFMEPVSFFLTGMEKHSDYFKPELLGNSKAFVKAMLNNFLSFPCGSLFTAMNELSNHDHSRFLTRTNKMHGRVDNLGYEAASQNIDLPIFILGVIMQMTLIGAPTIYYADEAGQVGFTDPDNRRTYPWGNEDLSLIELHKKLIELRNENIAFLKGSVIFLNQEENMLVYARFFKDNKIIVLINIDDKQRLVNVPVWRLEAYDNDEGSVIFSSNINGEYYSVDRNEVFIKDGMMEYKVEEKSGVIIKIR